MVWALAVRSPAAHAQAAENKLLLEVVINGRDTQKLADFIERAARPGGRSALCAERADLRALGLRVPADRTQAGPHPDGGALVCLSSLAGITYRLDGPTQTLDIRATDRALVPASLDASGLDSHAGAALPPLRTGTGAVLNYDATETFDGGRAALRGLLDGRVFSRGAVLDTGYLLAAGPDAGIVRLDTTLSYADPDTLRSYRAGDIINGGLSWSRPVRIGGLQLQSDFAVRPDLVTFPLPQINGSAAVPSTVDVLVNNVHLLSHNVDPGPFALTQLPIVSGANTVTLVTRDALGQQTTQTLPFYTTTRLLLPGLAAYSVELGAIRDGYGLRSEDYSRPVASGTVRYGLSRLVTLEAHGETAASLGEGGAGVAVNLGNLGVLTGSAAGSTHGARTGTQLSAGIERVGRLLTVSASYQRASPSYADQAALVGDPVPRQQMRVTAGLSLGRAGALNLAWTTIDTRPAAAIRGVASDQAAAGLETDTLGVTNQYVRTALLSVTYTARVWGSVQGYATGFHDFAQTGATGVVTGLSVPLGLRRSISATAGSATAGSAGRDGYLTEQASQAAVSPGEIGGTMLNQNGMQSRQMAQAGAATAFGNFDAGIDHFGHATAWRTGQSGALAALDGGVFAGQSIADSFAVVDTGLAHVQVLQENRPVGATGQDGRLLLPNLQSFASNRIGLDPASIPLDSDTRSASETVRPQTRTGVVVRFALKPRASATMRLVDETGAPLPVGSIATLAPDGAANVIGYDGIAFIRDLKAQNVLRVKRRDGKRCSLAFGYAHTGDRRPDLGQLTCRAEVR